MRIINLLPKHKQQEVRYESIFHVLLRFCALSAGSFMVVFLALFATRLYLLGQMSKLDAQIEQLKVFSNKQENTQLRNQVKSMNNVIMDYRKLADTSPRWSKVLLALAPLVPDSVNIQSLSIDLKTKKADILGFSPTRQAVIDLHDNIAKDEKNFANIDYPLENVAKPADIAFHYSFIVQGDLLKP